MTNNIKITRTNSPKPKPDSTNLGFGKYFTDHMFIMDYNSRDGWHNKRILPYGPITLDPSAMVFHYGQAIFEGLKAYRVPAATSSVVPEVAGTLANGASEPIAPYRILLFRPEMNMKRVNISNARLCIPPVDVDECVAAIKSIVDIDRDWVPSAPGTSLYIRPFILATEAHLGVRPSETYHFIIILSPVGAYYPEGLNPVKIFVESNYVRAVRGGIGYAKTPANYVASLKAQMEAKDKGFTQVLWLDGVEKKNVEEVGTMNVFFKINGEVITPALQGSILPGVTRDTTIELLKYWGIKVTERTISIQEIFDAHANGTLEEVFGTGTAAVVSPVGELNWNGSSIKINDFEIGELSQRLYDTITKIQTNESPDTFGWTIEV
ncbi:MAG: branched-chain amino acid aminotransferase [Bacillota bacterium]